MTYIGQQPSTTFDSGIQDRFTGLTTNTVTLTHDISAETDILVVWNNIVQDSSTYSVGGAGNKTLTLGGSLVSADIVTVYYTNKVMQSVNPTAGSVTTTTINDGAVTNAKLANSSITLNGSAVSLGGSATIGGGKILQVGHVVSTSEVTNNSTSSFADGNLTLNFTPTASSSTVLLILQLSVFLNHTTSADASVQVKIFRDSTQIYDGGSTQNYHSASSNGNVRYSTPLIYRDSPNTTSQVTYTYDFKNPHSSQQIEISDNSQPSTLTAFEIGA